MKKNIGIYKWRENRNFLSSRYQEIEIEKYPDLFLIDVRRNVERRLKRSSSIRGVRGRGKGREWRNKENSEVLDRLLCTDMLLIFQEYWENRIDNVSPKGRRPRGWHVEGIEARNSRLPGCRSNQVDTTRMKTWKREEHFCPLLSNLLARFPFYVTFT